MSEYDFMARLAGVVAAMREHPFETLIAATSIAIVLAVFVILLTQDSEHMGDGKASKEQTPLEAYREAKRRGGK